MWALQNRRFFLNIMWFTDSFATILKPIAVLELRVFIYKNRAENRNRKSTATILNTWTILEKWGSLRVHTAMFL